MPLLTTRETIDTLTKTLPVGTKIRRAETGEIVGEVKAVLEWKADVKKDEALSVGGLVAKLVEEKIGETKG